MKVMPLNVDLSSGSYSTVDGLFIEGSWPESLDDYILHFKECNMSRYIFIGIDTDTGESIYADTTENIYTFLFNGCINSTSNDYAQKETRVHWTGGTDLYAEDQFYVQFDSQLEEYKMIYGCEMVLCDLDEIKNETDETKPCFLADSCKNRYDNLINNRGRKRRSSENNTVEPGQVYYKDGEIIVKRSNATTPEAPTTAPTEAPTEPTTEPTTEAPTAAPTAAPTTEAPTEEPTTAPTEAPTREPPTEPTTTDALQQAVANVVLIFFIGIL